MKPSAIVRKTIPFMLIRLAAYVIFFIGMCIYAFIVLKILGAIEEGFIAIILVALFGGGGFLCFQRYLPGNHIRSRSCW